MPYLLDIEKQVVAWFRELEADGKARCESIRLDPLGCLTLVLRPDRSEEDEAWLSYVAAQAPGKGAAVNFDEHGVLVLVLSRYAQARQGTLELPEATS